MRKKARRKYRAAGLCCKHLSRDKSNISFVYSYEMSHQNVFQRGSATALVYFDWGLLEGRFIGWQQNGLAYGQQETIPFFCCVFV
jgi:hypothetical protein